MRKGVPGVDRAGGALVSPVRSAPLPAADVVGELVTYARPALEAHGDWNEVSALVAESALAESLLVQFNVGGAGVGGTRR